VIERFLDILIFVCVIVIFKRQVNELRYAWEPDHVRSASFSKTSHACIKCREKRATSDIFQGVSVFEMVGLNADNLNSCELNVTTKSY